MSRQNYYARRRHRQRCVVDGRLVADLVVRERRTQARLGTRKLYAMLKPELAEAGVRIGPVSYTHLTLPTTERV